MEGPRAEMAEDLERGKTRLDRLRDESARLLASKAQEFDEESHKLAFRLGLEAGRKYADPSYGSIDELVANCWPKASRQIR